MTLTAWPATRNTLRVVGLISGTSVDGIDAAVVDASRQPAGGVSIQTRTAFTREFTQQQRNRILALCRPEAPLESVCAANVDVGEWFAAAALEAIKRAKLTPSDCDLIASHGQTIWHIPGHSTFQIGEAAQIAERTGLSVVSNFRARDIAAGGQGAPLVSYLDYLVLRDAVTSRAAQNLGGIGNVTWIPAGAAPTALRSFDTGPGNMLIDGVAHLLTGTDRDDNGARAGRGTVNTALLEELLGDAYYAEPPPKTTGREKFGESYARQIVARARDLKLSDADALATVTMLTARTIADSYRRFLGRVDEVIASGGGVHNRTLLRMLGEACGVPVRSSAEVGLDPDFKEAIAFAVFGALTAWGEPSNLPAATGARRPVVMGDLTPA